MIVIKMSRLLRLGNNRICVNFSHLLRRCRVLWLGFLDRLIAEPNRALATGRGQHLAAVLLADAGVELGGGGHGRGGQELAVSGRCCSGGSQAVTDCLSARCARAEPEIGGFVTLIPPLAAGSQPVTGPRVQKVKVYDQL